MDLRDHNFTNLINILKIRGFTRDVNTVLVWNHVGDG